MVRESFDTTGDEQEMDDMTTGTTAPVPPFGGTQSLAGSPTYDVYANTQMGRLSRIVALHAGVSEPRPPGCSPSGWPSRPARPWRPTPASPASRSSGSGPLVKDIALASVGGPVSADLQKMIDALSAADGVILVSPVFQASYSGLFKSAMDVLPAGTR